MTDDTFTITYLKKQEIFLMDVVRRCIEAESKLANLQSDHSELQNKHSVMTEQLTQVLAGLEETTNQRNAYRDEHAKYRDEIISLGDLKQECDKIKKNFDDHMTNYNLVNEAFQKLQQEHQALLDSQQKAPAEEKKINKKKDDWS
jgi:chromosome segregation ATPase